MNPSANPVFKVGSFWDAETTLLAPADRLVGAVAGGSQDAAHALPVWRR